MHANRRLTVPHRLDQAIGRHRRRRLLVGEKLSEPRHIASAAVLVKRSRHQLLRFTHAQRAVARQNLHADRVGFVRIRPRHAGAHPINERLMIARSLRKTLTPFMRHFAQGFQDEKAVIGKSRIDPTSAEIRGEPRMIQLGGVAAQRKLEAILPGQLAMTRSHVAASAGQQRFDVLPERRRWSGTGARDGNRHPHPAIAQGHEDFGAAIAARATEAIGFHRDDIGLAAGKRHFTRHVRAPSVRCNRSHQQRMSAVGSRQFNRRRMNDQSRRLERRRCRRAGWEEQRQPKRDERKRRACPPRQTQGRRTGSGFRFWKAHSAAQ